MRYSEPILIQKSNRCRLTAARNGWRQSVGFLLECSVLTDLSERESAMMQWLTAGNSRANVCFIFSGVMDT